MAALKPNLDAKDRNIGERRAAEACEPCRARFAENLEACEIMAFAVLVGQWYLCIVRRAARYRSVLLSIEYHRCSPLRLIGRGLAAQGV
jgi:hypothetical protein